MSSGEGLAGGGGAAGMHRCWRTSFKRAVVLYDEIKTSEKILYSAYA